MKKKFVSNTIKRLSKQCTKTKKGSTLVELICTIAILAIVSTICLSSLYSLSSISEKGQNISVAQRSCSLFSEQFAVYAKNSPYIQLYNSMPATFNGYDSANPSSQKSYLMDADVATMGDYDEFLIYEGSQPNTIVFAKFNGNIKPFTPNSFEVINKIDNIKSIEFKRKKLTGTSNRYLIEYSIVAIESVHDTGDVTYTIDGGIVLNNITDATNQFKDVPTAGFKIGEGTGKVLRIRATDRSKVDRD